MSWRTFSLAGWAAIAAFILVLLALSYCAVTAPGRTREKIETANAAANNHAHQVDAGARETAADDRLADALANANLKEELSHAVEPLPDAVPSARRRALGCARLRQQDVDTAALSACS